MPTYDYTCPRGHTKEVRHGMEEDPDVRCDEDVRVDAGSRFKHLPCSAPMEKQISGGFRPRVKGGTPVHHERGKKRFIRKTQVSVNTGPEPSEVSDG